MIKNMLKGGLRSLIPNRDVKDPDEALDDLEKELAGNTQAMKEEVLEEEEAVEINISSEQPATTPADQPEPSADQPDEDENEADEKKEEDDEGIIKIRRPKGESSQSGAVPEPAAPSESEEEEPVPLPPKPNVTPLEIDFEEEITPIPAKEEIKEETNKGDMWNKHEDTVQHVLVNEISINPNQPRRQFDRAEMDDLRQSIAQHGILQPLVVRRVSDNQYELVAGERRLRAAKELSWEKVPCVVRMGVNTSATRLQLALIENIQRQDLNPIDEALAYQQLNEEYGMTHEEIGERVGRSRVGITNIIRVLQLPEEIQKGLIDGKISSGHAKAILMIPDSEKQVRFYRHLVEEGLTVRKAESRARRIQRTMHADDPLRHIRRQGRSVFEIKCSGLLEDRYGHHAQLRFDEGKNRYEVVFKCFSKEEIDQLVGRLMGTESLPEQGQDKDVIEEKGDE